MSNYDSNSFSQDVQNQAGNTAKKIAKTAGNKTARKLGKAASKAVVKLLKTLIKAIFDFIVKAVVTALGGEAILIILAVLAFAVILSAIPFGDWFLGTGKTSEEDLLKGQQYQQRFNELSEASVLPIDNEDASEDWKITLKTIVQPNWAIPASFSRYEMVRQTGKVTLPDTEIMFSGLEPTFEYTTITNDKEYIKTVSVCYYEETVVDDKGNAVLDTEGNEVTKRVAGTPTTSVSERKLPEKKILSKVSIPFGYTDINSIVKYYPGGTLEDENQWSEGVSSTSGDCYYTTYTRQVKTVVDDRGVPFTNFDDEAFKAFVISKGVKEQHLDEYFEYVIAADPDFPIDIYQGLMDSESGYSPIQGSYTISGEMVDGWVWPIANTPMNVNSYFGARWGRNHNGVDLGGRAYKNAPILAARAGTVVYAGKSATFGNWVIMSHDNDLQTRYAHMTSYNVKVGDVLAAGDQIGIQGSTGRSTGPHLHFEVLIPNPKNPFGKTGNSKQIFDPMIFLEPIRSGGK